MAQFSYNEDEDAKADELPSDEEGDAITKNIRPFSANNTEKKPKIPPPVLGNLYDNNNLKLQVSNPQSSHSVSSNDNGYYSPDVDTADIMAYSPNMQMRVHSKHIPSKTMPISMDIPQFWACQVCTFAENSLSKPMCSICGALPPVDGVKKSQKRKNKASNLNKNSKKQAIQNPLIQPPPQPQPPPAINNNIYNNLSPRANQPKHHQHELWVQQHHEKQSRQRRHDHPSHFRGISAQMPSNASSNVNQNLPHFLEEDDEKDSDQPSYMKKNSIANLVTKEYEISVLNEIPQQEKDLIVKQINKIPSKKDLQIELYSVKMTLMKKIKFHNRRIIAINKQKSRAKSEYDIQSTLWNKYYIILLQKLCKGYFDKLFTLIDVRISIEKFYLQCFELKMEKVSTAYNKLDETIDEWDINATRQYVKTVMFTVSKIRTSADVHKKKKEVDKLKASINKMEKHYEAKKEELEKSKVDHKKRSAYITLYLKTVIDEFNAHNKNIKLTETYFCKSDVQENFNSFLLDQRVEVGKIVNNWLVFLKENKDKNKEVLFKDVYIFIERLINTFCKVYKLQETANGKYNYKEYCMRFVYPSILNLTIVNQILQSIANTEQGKKEYQLLCVLSEYALFTHFLRLKYRL